MISEFYEDSEIFITGGSGVVGKAAIEKLFRSCNVKKIFVLLRSKRGVGAKERLRDIKNSRIFNLLKEVKPNELDKLVAISGDIAEDGLGISEADKELLKNVSVFFHSAATTRFNAPLKMAIRLNLKSTLESLKLAETFRNLKIFIHISTFFCNPFVKHIQDKVYPAVFDWRVALKLLDSEGDEINSNINSITDKLISGFPNTYLFTKHLAEQLVNEYRTKLPIGIYRPSIVVCSLEEPEPGFTETMIGVMGLLAVWGSGLLKILRCSPKIFLDLTPLDTGTKHLLIFTAYTGQQDREKLKESTPIAMHSSKHIMNFSFDEIQNTVTKCMKQHPNEKSAWIPGLRLTGSAFIFGLYTFFLQIIPSIIIDILLRILGQRPVMMLIQRKIYLNVKALSFFLNQDFTSDGVTNIIEFAQIARKTEFNIDVLFECCKDKMRFTNCMMQLVKGCRKFLLNEDEGTMPRAIKLMKWKIFLYNTMKAITLLLVVRAIYRRAMTYISV